MLLPRNLSRLWLFLASLSCLPAFGVEAISLDITSTDSIKAAASIIATDLMSIYVAGPIGNGPGTLPQPYYWWESGEMWGSMINYWHCTGDTTYVNMTITGLQDQVGQYNDYEPARVVAQLGNDDQGYWGMAAMAAAEYAFPNPPDHQPSWLALAQAVFNRQAGRWDNRTCGGGLRWQVFQFNNGYDYKNSIANGILFNMAARLAKFTGNVTYQEWANKVFDWEVAIGLVDEGNLAIYDGTTPSQNCTSINHQQWSYEVVVHLLGCANMWNITQSDLWYKRTQWMLEATKTFFREDTANTTPYIMYEAECELQGNCNTDMLSYKSNIAAWMAATTLVAPWTYDYVRVRLEASAQAAAAICVAGANGTECGFQWFTGLYNATPGTGAGQQMNALEVIQSLLISQVSAPVTASTGGNSTSNPSAGTGTGTTIDFHLFNIQTNDIAGAWTLTGLLAISTISGALWSLWE